MSENVRKWLGNPLIYLFAGVGLLWVIALGYSAHEEKVEERPRLVYSFPPNCPEVDISDLPPGEIPRLAGELGLTPLFGGQYYQNGRGACFTPAQVPVLAANAEEYERELAEHW